MVIIAATEIAFGGKLLKKMTKELKKVNKYFYTTVLFFQVIHIFQPNLSTNIQVLGGSKFEDFVANNLVDVSNIKVRGVLHYKY